MRVGILLTCREHLQYDRIMSLKGTVWAYKHSLAPHIFLKCPYQARQVSGHVFVCQGYRFCLSFYDYPIIAFNCSDGVVFLFHNV